MCTQQESVGALTPLAGERTPPQAQRINTYNAHIRTHAYETALCLFLRANYQLSPSTQATQQWCNTMLFVFVCKGDASMNPPVPTHNSTSTCGLQSRRTPSLYFRMFATHTPVLDYIGISTRGAVQNETCMLLPLACSQTSPNQNITWKAHPQPPFLAFAATRCWGRNVLDCSSRVMLLPRVGGIDQRLLYWTTSLAPKGTLVSQ